MSGLANIFSNLYKLVIFWFKMVSRGEALELMHKWVESESLRRHCLGVATCMEAYARKYGLDEEEVDAYWIAGLLHDYDYEKFPSLDKHPFKGVEVLKEKGYPKEIINSILGHSNHTGVARETKMAKTLFAVDELSGLVVALAKVRPGNFDGMSPKSVKKAMKKKDFAAAINRDDIRQGVEELGVEQAEHFNVVVEALSGIRSELGF